MAEIVRVGGWALRGLGYSYGVSERAVPMLAWMEAATGGALSSIRKRENAIMASCRSRGLSAQASPAGGRHVEACGHHLIEVGPPAMDVLTVDVRRAGQGSLALASAIGSNFVPALAHLLAHRKLAGAALVKADDGQTITCLTFGPGYVSEAVQEADDGAPFFLDGATDPDRAARAWTGHRVEARSATDGYVGFVAWRGEEAPRLEGAENLVERVEKAWSFGIETALEDIQYLYKLETRAWAPTSERSRSQAGYGKF
jgi:hypothetical protein